MRARRRSHACSPPPRLEVIDRVLRIPLSHSPLQHPTPNTPSGAWVLAPGTTVTWTSRDGAPMLTASTSGTIQYLARSRPRSTSSASATRPLEPPTPLEPERPVWALSRRSPRCCSIALPLAHLIYPLPLSPLSLLSLARSLSLQRIDCVHRARQPYQRPPHDAWLQLGVLWRRPSDETEADCGSRQQAAGGRGRVKCNEGGVWFHAVREQALGGWRRGR